MPKINIPQNVVAKAAVIDTGKLWRGLKILIVVPLTGSSNPVEIAKLFNCDLTRLANRAQQLTLNDLYQYEQIIRQRIEAGEPLLAN